MVILRGLAWTERNIRKEGVGRNAGLEVESVPFFIQEAFAPMTSCIVFSIFMGLELIRVH
jgi:hypothetical protein